MFGSVSVNAVSCVGGGAEHLRPGQLRHPHRPTDQGKFNLYCRYITAFVCLFVCMYGMICMLCMVCMYGMYVWYGMYGMVCIYTIYAYTSYMYMYVRVEHEQAVHRQRLQPIEIAGQADTR